MAGILHVLSEDLRGNRSNDEWCGFATIVDSVIVGCYDGGMCVM